MIFDQFMPASYRNTYFDVKRVFLSPIINIIGIPLDKRNRNADNTPTRCTKRSERSNSPEAHPM